MIRSGLPFNECPARNMPRIYRFERFNEPVGERNVMTIMTFYGFTLMNFFKGTTIKKSCLKAPDNKHR